MIPALVIKEGYDFASRRVTQITKLQTEFTGSFAISPDGQWIVFERSKSLDENREIDLWVTRIDGGNPRLLTRNGFSPSWRAGSAQAMD